MPLIHFKIHELLTSNDESIININYLIRFFAGFNQIQTRMAQHERLNQNRPNTYCQKSQIQTKSTSENHFTLNVGIIWFLLPMCSNSIIKNLLNFMLRNAGCAYWDIIYNCILWLQFVEQQFNYLCCVKLWIFLTSFSSSDGTYHGTELHLVTMRSKNFKVEFNFCSFRPFFARRQNVLVRSYFSGFVSDEVFPTIYGQHFIF